MKSSYFILFLLFLPGAKAIQAQNYVLEGSIISDSRKPISGIPIMVYGYGKNSVSDSKGGFRFDLPSSFKGGYQIKFRLLTGRWIIQNPFDGVWNLNDPFHKGIYDTRIVLVPNGSPALWTHEVMTEFIDQMQEAMVLKNRTIDRLQNPSPSTFEDFIAEWAAPHGYTLNEIRKELNKWLADTENTQDEGDLGRREFLKKNFNQAARFYLKKIDKIEREAKESLYSVRIEKFEYYTLMGEAFFLAYNLDSARWAYEKAERVFGEQTSFNQWFAIKLAIGKIYDRQGRYRSSRNIYNAIEVRLMESLNIDSTKLSLVYNNLGSAYYSLGASHRAINYYEKALLIAKEYYGERHPTVAKLLNNLGSVYLSLGENHRAISYYEKALKIDLEYYGGHHPDISRDYINLGRVQKSVGENHKAFSYYEKSLLIDQQYFGEDHPDLARDYTNLGSAEESRGEYQKAINYYERSLSIDQEYYGERHPDIARDFNNLGSANLSLGEYQKATTYYEKALLIAQECYGGRHPTVAVIYNNLGSAEESLGEYKKAISHYEKSLSIDLEFYGLLHPDIAKDYNNLGSAYKSLGEYQKAFSFFEKSLSINLEYYDDDHPDVARDYNNLGSVKESLGEYQKAIRYYESALLITKECYGESHPTVAILYNNLGSAITLSGDYQKAISYNERALLIAQKYYGESHPTVAVIFNNLGSTFKAMGNNKKAISYFEKARSIDQEYFGESHHKVAIDNNNLGSTYQSLGEYQKAIDCYEKALTISTALLPTNHPNCQTIIVNLVSARSLYGMTAFRQEDYQTALERWRSGLDLVIGLGNGELAANFCNDIGSALNHLGHYQAALDTLGLGWILLDSLILSRQKEIKSLPDSLRQHPNFLVWERNYLFYDLRTRLRYHRAGALLGLGRHGEAKRIFKDLEEQALREGDKRLLEDLEKFGY